MTCVPVALCRRFVAIASSLLGAGALLAAPAVRGPADAAAGLTPVFLDDFETSECSHWSASSNPSGAPDADLDDFGDDLQPTVFCQLPAGMVPDATDCADSDASVHPGAPEMCNGVDDDCNDVTPDGEGDPGVGVACDGADGDLCAEGTIFCSGATLVCSDTSDTNLEVCNAVDDDCDGATDADDPDLVLVPCENQAGVCAGALKTADLCAGGSWLVCTDQQYALHSLDYENPEVSCDGLDNDCDGAVDEGNLGDTNPACVDNTFLGTVPGDTGAAQVTASSFDERFYRVTVQEQNGLSMPLTVSISLAQPPTVNFDLYVYCLSCGGTMAGSSTLGAGQTDVVAVGRDDGIGDQSFDLLIEVRYASASPCGFWLLTVTGNQPTANRACN